jgi:hypothetical protein
MLYATIYMPSRSKSLYMVYFNHMLNPYAIYYGIKCKFLAQEMWEVGIQPPNLILFNQKSQSFDHKPGVM